MNDGIVEKQKYQEELDIIIEEEKMLAEKKRADPEKQGENTKGNGGNA